MQLDRFRLKCFDASTYFLLICCAGSSVSCAAFASKPVLQRGDLLCSFETEAEMKSCTGSAPFKQSTDHASLGDKSVEVDLNAAEATFGIRADGRPFDFTGTSKLKFDVFRPGDPCHIILRVFDRDKKRYVVWYSLVRSGKNTLEFDVHGMSTELDLAKIDELVLYAEQPVGKLYLDNVRLTRNGEVDDIAPPPSSGKPERIIPGNLIKNGGFELGLAEWESWGEWDDGKYLFGTAQGEEANHGAAAVEITAKKVGRGGIWSQPLFLPPGNYELRFAAKGKGNGVKTFWTFDGDGKHNIATGLRCQPFAVGSDWKSHRFEVGVGRAAAVVRLYLFSVGDGTLLLDDISLVNTDRVADTVADRSNRNWRPKTVALAGQNLTIDGKPVFPIGIFNGKPEALKGTGINFIVSGMPDEELLESCRKTGIMICPNLQGVMRAHLPWQAPKVIEPIMNHPSILAWYLCDEPDHSGWTVPPAEMRLATKLLNKTDPNHPVWTVVMSWADSNLFQYGDTVNILSSDVYPFADGKKNPLEVVANKAAVLRKAVKEERPVWMTTQATKVATPLENRAMTYLAICGGARGIVYWEFYEANGDPTTWKTVVDLTLELKTLSPILTAPAPANTLAISNPNVHAILREYDGSLFVLAVNGSANPVGNVGLAVSDLTGTKSANVLMEKREFPIREGRFADDFGPYERHIYEIPKTVK